MLVVFLFICVSNDIDAVCDFFLYFLPLVNLSLSVVPFVIVIM